MPATSSLRTVSPPELIALIPLTPLHDRPSRAGLIRDMSTPESTAPAKAIASKIPAASRTVAAAQPGWMKPGVEVVVDHGRDASGGPMYHHTIAKVTKTRIELEDGTRFSTRDLYEIGRSTWDSTQILDPSNPRTEVRWLQFQQKTLRSNLAYEIGETLKQFASTADIALAEQALAKLNYSIERYKSREAKIDAASANLMSGR